ncbi:N(4)-(Beta-N-acetylglucosaminyl)-L-asparaginase-like [Glandiceps talaboti]
MGVLENDKSPVNAIEAAIKECEEDRDICSSGVGHSVDDTGEQTLDAMIMDGKTHNVGAVGGLRRVKYAITAARYVMDYTKHSLLVGDLATQFAHTFAKLQNESLSTEGSDDAYAEWRRESCTSNFWENVTPDPTKSCGPFQRIQTPNTGEMVELDEDNHDTIGMVVVDKNGDFAVGTSTSGLKFKIAGRVGDSAIVGSGAYADNYIGGATATGNGDVMMRFKPSYQTVENMRLGMSPSEAAADALSRIAYRFSDFGGSVMAVNKEGEVGGACYRKNPGHTVEFAYMTGAMSEVATFKMDCTVEGKKAVFGEAATIQISKILFVFFAPYLYLYI